MKTHVNLAFIALSMLLANCDSAKKDQNISSTTLPPAPTTTIQPFIAPPLKTVNIPFEKQEVIAENGGTLQFSSGSSIEFPPNAFLDKEGKPIKGKVDITFREFSDPLDFFLSGIPMSYDSAGTTYTFESSGMCETYAYQDKQPVFVNPQQQPKVSLVSRNSDPKHNLYVLDTLQRKWVNMGKSKIESITDKEEENDFSEKVVKTKPIPKPVLVKAEVPELPPSPIEPQKANEAKYRFSVDLDVQGANLVPELKIFNNTKFEVDESEKNYNPQDANHQWSYVKLTDTKTKGVYLITFSNKKLKRSYRVRPVYQGKDYDEALKIFKKKKRKHERERMKLDAKRKEKEEKAIRAWKEKMERWKKEEKKRKLLAEQKRKRIEEIRKRNREIAEQKRRRIEESYRIRKQLKKERALREKEMEKQNFENGGVYMAQEVTRTFQMAKFGVWNCDQPKLTKAIPIYASFKSKNGKELKPESLTIVYKNFNGIFCNPSSSTIRLIPKAKTMIWGVQGNDFMYLTYNDFENYIIKENKNLTFTMRIPKEKIKSRKDIRELLRL